MKHLTQKCAEGITPPVADVTSTKSLRASCPSDRFIIYQELRDKLKHSEIREQIESQPDFIAELDIEEFEFPDADFDLGEFHEDQLEMPEMPELPDIQLEDREKSPLKKCELDTHRFDEANFSKFTDGISQQTQNVFGGMRNIEARDWEDQAQSIIGKDAKNIKV